MIAKGVLYCVISVLFAQSLFAGRGSSEPVVTPAPLPSVVPIEPSPTPLPSDTPLTDDDTTPNTISSNNLLQNPVATGMAGGAIGAGVIGTALTIKNKQNNKAQQQKADEQKTKNELEINQLKQTHQKEIDQINQKPEYLNGFLHKNYIIEGPQADQLIESRINIQEMHLEMEKIRVRMEKTRRGQGDGKHIIEFFPLEERIKFEEPSGINNIESSIIAHERKFSGVNTAKEMAIYHEESLRFYTEIQKKYQEALRLEAHKENMYKAAKFLKEMSASKEFQEVINIYTYPYAKKDNDKLESDFKNKNITDAETIENLKKFKDYSKELEIKKAEFFQEITEEQGGSEREIQNQCMRKLRKYKKPFSDIANKIDQLHEKLRNIQSSSTNVTSGGAVPSDSASSSSSKNHVKIDSVNAAADTLKNNQGSSAKGKQPLNPTAPKEKKDNLPKPEEKGESSKASVRNDSHELPHQNEHVDPHAHLHEANNHHGIK